MTAAVKENGLDVSMVVSLVAQLDGWMAGKRDETKVANLVDQTVYRVVGTKAHTMAVAMVASMATH